MSVEAGRGEAKEGPQGKASTASPCPPPFVIRVSVFAGVPHPPLKEESPAFQQCSLELSRAPKAVATLQGFMNELKREVAAGRRGPWVSRRQVEVSHWGLKPQRAGPQLGVKHLVSGPK